MKEIYKIEESGITYELTVEQMAKYAFEKNMPPVVTATHGKDFCITATWNVQGNGMVEICVIKDGKSEWAKPVQIAQASDYIEKLKQHFEGVNT